MDVIAYVKKMVPDDLEVRAETAANQDAIDFIVVTKEGKHPTAFSISGLEQVQNDDAGLRTLADARLETATGMLRDREAQRMPMQ